MIIPTVATRVATLLNPQGPPYSTQITLAPTEEASETLPITITTKLELGIIEGATVALDITFENPPEEE